MDWPGLASEAADQCPVAANGDAQLGIRWSTNVALLRVPPIAHDLGTPRQGCHKQRARLVAPTAIRTSLSVWTPRRDTREPRLETMIALMKNMQWLHRSMGIIRRKRNGPLTKTPAVFLADDVRDPEHPAICHGTAPLSTRAQKVSSVWSLGTFDHSSLPSPSARRLPRLITPEEVSFPPSPLSSSCSSA